MNGLSQKKNPFLMNGYILDLVTCFDNRGFTKHYNAKIPHTLGRLPDIIHIHGAFIRATTFLHQSGIASFCQSYFFVVEVVYDDRFAFFRASVWQIVYTIREALLLGVI